MKYEENSYVQLPNFGLVSDIFRNVEKVIICVLINSIHAFMICIISRLLNAFQTSNIFHYTYIYIYKSCEIEISKCKKGTASGEYY